MVSCNRGEKKIGRHCFKKSSAKDVSGVGSAFWDDELADNNRNLKVEATPDGDYLMLIGYDWAIYGIKEVDSPNSIFFEGWDGYSPTTSKHLSQTGMRTASMHVKDAPRTSDIYSIIEDIKKGRLKNIK